MRNLPKCPKNNVTVKRLGAMPKKSILTREAKRKAAETFRLPGNATDSSTASESEVERLESYPEPPSPRSSSRRMRQKLGLGSRRYPGKESKRESLFDEAEDDVRKQRRSFDAFDTVKEVDAQKKAVLGGVTLDAKPGERDWEKLTAPATYKEWQTRRQEACAKTEDNTVAPDVPLSNMGVFAKLPGELRNRIYRLSLAEAARHHYQSEPGTCSLGPCKHMKLTSCVPGLLSTCRQIRYEAMSTFCSENTISFDSGLVRDRCVANWLRTLGPFGRLIPKLELNVLVWKPISPNREKKIGYAYSLTIECPAGQLNGEFRISIPKSMRVKDGPGCKRLESHIEDLNKRVGEEAHEKLLLEFVWSDWLAELVYQCKK